MDKIYVKVTALFDEDGKITPKEIIWEDGRRFTITRVHEVIRTASTKAGGTGYRYTITVEGKRRNIWLEDIKFDKAIGARWFVEGVSMG